MARNTNLPAGSKHTGWYNDGVNGLLEWYNRGTKIGQHTGSTTTFTGALAATTSFSATTSIAATTTVTAGTGLTVTTGHATVSAGNVVLGNPGAFATTQAVAAVKMGGSSLGGTAPVGAITTSAAIFASDTVVRKIIADGTVSNVET